MSQWIRALAVSGGVLVGGWALINYITPTKEQLLEKLQPEERNLIKSAAEEQRQDALIKIIKESAASNEPIWKIHKPNNKTNSNN